jgi:hypothetical protein
MDFGSFLKQKSEVFRKFQVKPEVQIGHEMECFIYENGGEFMSKKFNQFSIENGILRQLTIPHTLQQNGVVKKKNCILF